MSEVARCGHCGGLLCSLCNAHVDAPDVGLRVICEECADRACEENGITPAPLGGLLHLEAHYSLDEQELESDEDPTKWN